MISKPTGPQLTEDQARELDDRFFRSRPFDYFRSRIAFLLMPDPPAADLEHGAGRDFAAALGMEAGELARLLTVDARERDLQAAVDSFAVRHHAAESLVRLYHALAVATLANAGPRCLWAAIADGPVNIADLANEVREHLRSEAGRDGFWRFVLPQEVAALAQRDDLDEAVTVAARWVWHATTLLTQDDLNIDKAHNKVKHGLAVRAQDDELMLFTQQGPDADGNLPLSAVTGDTVVPLIDSISLAFLSRPSRFGGLEVSTLCISPPTVLAEAWLMVTVHGAMFHLAARQHLGESKDELLPPLVRLPRGPSPTTLLGTQLTGFRSPITTPTKGGGPPRIAAIGWSDGSYQEVRIDYDAASKGTIVDDPVASAEPPSAD